MSRKPRRSVPAPKPMLLWIFRVTSTSRQTSTQTLTDKSKVVGLFGQMPKKSCVAGAEA